MIFTFQKYININVYRFFVVAMDDPDVAIVANFGDYVRPLGWQGDFWLIYAVALR